MVFKRSLLTQITIATCLFFTPASAVDKQPANGSQARPVPTGAPDPTSFFPRPIPMGVSISNTPSQPFIYAGTAGLRVRGRGNPNNKFILSNNHVLGAQGPTLCPGSANANARAVQPGTLDIGSDPGPDPQFVVGRFSKRVDMVPLGFGTNLVDAAIAGTNTALASTEILGIGEP